ncbi:hypothetical protein E1B28_005694 [Marasmius oreades]|uniref:Uncharacterized protein n=1 Tax=Marasmius oreades TaxID=181124 RepID=A0A9P7S413_9AGAR|nr:uncharacterized protein E1B28_005694 [Marasmius oreades]KAG7094887.1 hypothetical protein E1B28_005694 [Marasmius oreades]
MRAVAKSELICSEYSRIPHNRNAVSSRDPGEVTTLVGTYRPSQHGDAKATVFASSGVAEPFDFQAGDVSYIPPSFGGVRHT